MPASWTIAALETTPRLRLKPVPLSPAWWRLYVNVMISAFSSTWLNLMVFMVFLGVVCFLCVHEGPTMVHRFAESVPRVLGRWLKRKGDGEDSGGRTTATNASVNTPLSASQSWKLGALHERYLRAREESNLREAGDVLGRPRPLTEVPGTHIVETRGRLSRVEMYIVEIGAPKSSHTQRVRSCRPYIQDKEDCIMFFCSPCITRGRLLKLYFYLHTRLCRYILRPEYVQRWV